MPLSNKVSGNIANQSKGTLSQVNPPLSVLKIVPSAPTMKPFFLSTKHTRVRDTLRVLFSPIRSSIVCMQDQSAVTHYPPVSSDKKDALKDIV